MTAISLNAAFAASPVAVRLPRFKAPGRRAKSFGPSWTAIVTPLVTELPLLLATAAMTFAIASLF